MAKLHIAALAALLLLAVGSHARMIQEPVPTTPQPGNPQLLAEDQQVGHGAFRFDYMLYIKNASNTHSPVITGMTMESIWGCGARNQKCSCEAVNDPNWMIPNAVSMQGAGTDGTATGLEFLCRFTVAFENPETGSSMPGCRCALHINMPYSGANVWEHDCTCLEGFEATIPQRALVVSTSDSVQRKL